MYLAQNLKYLRERFGYSQTEIAEKTRCKHYTTVLKWEKGITEIPIRKLIVLSKLYGYSVDVLMEKDLENDGVLQQMQEIVEREIDSTHNNTG